MNRPFGETATETVAARAGKSTAYRSAGAASTAVVAVRNHPIVITAVSAAAAAATPAINPQECFAIDDVDGAGPTRSPVALIVSSISIRATPMCGMRFRESFSRLRLSSVRIAIGVVAGSAFQSGVSRITAVSVSVTSSPANALRFAASERFV